jgi:hypothetical protein
MKGVKRPVYYTVVEDACHGVHLKYNTSALVLYYNTSGAYRKTFMTIAFITRAQFVNQLRDSIYEHFLSTPSS